MASKVNVPFAPHCRVNMPGSNTGASNGVSPVWNPLRLNCCATQFSKARFPDEPGRRPASIPSIARMACRVPAAASTTAAAGAMTAGGGTAVGSSAATAPIPPTTSAKARTAALRSPPSGAGSGNATEITFRCISSLTNATTDNSTSRRDRRNRFSNAFTTSSTVRLPSNSPITKVPNSSSS